MPDTLTDLHTGLTSAQARALCAQGRDNRPPAAPTKTVGRIVWENTCTFFNLVFLALAAALWAVGSVANMGFLAVAVCNTCIGIGQQLRARAAIDRLTLVAERPVRCLRDGTWGEIPARALVEGDIVAFAAGDQICADALVRAGTASLNEALLTGEADAVAKAPGDALRSGSFVLAGRCTAQLTAVGAYSYANRLTVAAKTHRKPPKSEMMASLDRLIRFAGAVLAPLGALLFLKQYALLGLSLRDATEGTVAALIGMIPEGLYLLTSVALAVSVVRLGRRGVLTRDLNCIETLARVDVLCVDKTGTITEPGMDAQEPVLLDAPTWPAARVCSLLGELYADAEPENDTARALAGRFAAYRPADGGRAVCGRVPFSPEYKWSAALLEDGAAFVIGAPSFVAGARRKELDEAMGPLLARGCRVLLLAACNALPDPAAGLDPDALRFVALLPLCCRLRPNAARIFAWFEQQGVQIKVLSGDDPCAAAQVAREAGITGAGRLVDAAALPDAAIEQAAEAYTVFGRVTPEQKCRLVRALRKAGHRVAMTGDGVNDVLALRDADCGIAMAGGAQAACQAAQMVLLDADFAALPAIVAEGRRVINNIQRTASLFLVKNIFSFLLSVLTLAVPFAYPLEPLQLTVVGMATIGLPAFVLALGPERRQVRGHFMRNVLSAALPGGLTDLALVLAAQAAAWALGLTRAQASAVCTGVLLGVGLCVLWGACIPFTRGRALLWGGMLALGVAGMAALDRLLGLHMGHAATLALLAALLAAVPPALALSHRACRRAARWRQNTIDKRRRPG